MNKTVEFWERASRKFQFKKAHLIAFLFARVGCAMALRLGGRGRGGAVAGGAGRGAGREPWKMAEKASAEAHAKVCGAAPCA
eukprot:1826320-Rhodomonas_salina.1